MTVEIL